MWICLSVEFRCLRCNICKRKCVTDTRTQKTKRQSNAHTPTRLSDISTTLLYTYTRYSERYLQNKRTLHHVRNTFKYAADTRELLSLLGLPFIDSRFMRASLLFVPRISRPETVCVCCKSPAGMLRLKCLMFPIYVCWICRTREIWTTTNPRFLLPPPTAPTAPTTHNDPRGATAALSPTHICNNLYSIYWYILCI